MNVDDSTGDIAADEVCVHLFKVGRIKDASRQNTVTEARSETIYLIFQPLKHIYIGAIRHMTIRPRCVFACGSARAVEKTRLRE